MAFYILSHPPLPFLMSLISLSLVFSVVSKGPYWLGNLRYALVTLMLSHCLWVSLLSIAFKYSQIMRDRFIILSFRFSYLLIHCHDWKYVCMLCNKGHLVSKTHIDLSFYCVFGWPDATALPIRPPWEKYNAYLVIFAWKMRGKTCKLIWKLITIAPVSRG